MLDQLVESKDTAGQNTLKNELLLVTFVILSALLIGGWTFSLFNKDYSMGSGDLDISSLVAPVALPEEAPPPPPEPDVKPEKTQSVNSDKIIVKEFYADLNRIIDLKETKTTGVRDVKSVEGLDLKRAQKGSEWSIPQNATRPSGDGQTGGGLRDQTSSTKTDTKSDFDDLKVKTKPTPAKEVPKVISGGVVNGKAINLVKPPYPAAARAVRASGAVNVQVTIDERGNVISASAVSGHPLLRAAAVEAARASKFSPTLLSSQPVKVTGVIIYNFQP
jgi:protein TonB